MKKKKIRSILLFGKREPEEPSFGKVPGAMGGPVGILNVLQWQKNFLAKHIDIHAGGIDLNFPAS